MAVHMLIECIFVIKCGFILFCLLTAARACSSISLRVGPEQLTHLLLRKRRPRSDAVGYLLNGLPSSTSSCLCSAFKPRALDLREDVPSHCHYWFKPSTVNPFLLLCYGWPCGLVWVHETKGKSTGGFLEKVFLSDQRERHRNRKSLPYTHLLLLEVVRWWTV